jgi:tetratricopeptide (TPR) repeat protein
MMKTAFMVITAALFSSGVMPTNDSGPARPYRTPPPAAAAATIAATTLSLVAPAPWAPKDPADSLYREGRAALGKGDYAKAAEIFRRIYRQYPSSEYAGESLYYLAFSEYRLGGSDHLQSALSSLALIESRYPDLSKRSDARALRTRVCGELAQRGDEGCAAEVARSVSAAVAIGVGEAVSSAVSSAVSGAVAGAVAGLDQAAAGIRGLSSDSRRRAASGCPSEDDDDDERIAALNALIQMDAERAMPILTKVLERRDPCSAGLRRKAVFLVSQKRTPETADILLRIARNDPDQEVREQAVFWLSQVPDERAVTMLQEILNSSSSEELKDKALFALSQHRSERGAQFLRDYAMREDASDELRGKAIFWLGQRRSPETAEFLRSLYSRVKSDDVKEKILFSLSQQRGVGNDKWLIDIARNTRENIELRKKALFWAGQGAVPTDQLLSLYSTIPDSEMREQLIFVYAQRRELAMVDKLLDIAKNDRDPELRKKAIFWLGQSHDPRVQQFLLDLINR